MASMAANFLSTWGSERGAPECSTQLSSGGTPHVGQRTEDTCLGVSSFFFIRRETLARCSIRSTSEGTIDRESVLVG
jgi:hypothetical protein